MDNLARIRNQLFFLSLKPLKASKEPGHPGYKVPVHTPGGGQTLRPPLLPPLTPLLPPSRPTVLTKNSRHLPSSKCLGITCGPSKINGISTGRGNRHGPTNLLGSMNASGRTAGPPTARTFGKSAIPQHTQPPGIRVFPPTPTRWGQLSTFLLCRLLLLLFFLLIRR
jgi:hypothetical protein